MLRKIILLSLIVALLAFSLMGCWDQVEIDERIFIAIMGFDVAPTSPEENPYKDRYELTLAFPNQAGGAGGEVEITNVSLSSLGENMATVLRQMSTRTSKSVYFGHLRGLVIGEAVARDPKMLREVMDAYENNPLISRRIAIAIVQGEAKEVIGLEPEQEQNVGEFITDVFRRKDRTQRAALMDLGEVLMSLHTNGDVLVPRLIPGEKDIKAGGSAVIKDYTLVGWLGEAETLAATFAIGELRLALINIPHVDITIPYLITDGGAKYSVIKRENEIICKIEIQAEGDIEQIYLDPEVDVMDPEFIRGVQEHASSLIKEMTEGVLMKLQKEFNADVLDFGGYIKKYKPSLWKEIEGDWDEIYRNMTFEVVVDAKIRRVGLTR